MVLVALISWVDNERPESKLLKSTAQLSVLLQQQPRAY
jgi:hypothetical protein